MCDDHYSHCKLSHIFFNITKQWRVYVAGSKYFVALTDLLMVQSEIWLSDSCQNEIIVLHLSWRFLSLRSVLETYQNHNTDVTCYYFL